MESESLRLFLEVANRLSFAAVAEARGSNPSSVSRAIGSLEDELGLRLFHRTTRKMALTEEGALFRRRVAGILDELDAACDEARSAGAGPRGRLRLSTSVAFGERVILPLLPRFRAAQPAVTLDLLLSDSRLDLVAESIDLAIRLGPARPEEHIAAKLCDTRYRVCASPGYVAAAADLRDPGDLAAHRCLLFTLPAFRSEWRFRRRGDSEITVPVAGDLAISSALSLRSAALAGLGPALLADWLIGDDLAAGHLVDLFPAYEVTATSFDTAAWLLYPSRAYLPQKVRVMIDFLRANVRD